MEGGPRRGVARVIRGPDPDRRRPEHEHLPPDALHAAVSEGEGRRDPSLIVKTDDNVSASHGGTVGEIDEEQVYYMMTRGISRQDAVRTLVEGYFEEVVQRLEDDSLERIVREGGSRQAGGGRGAGRSLHRGAPDVGRPDNPSRRRADFPVLEREVQGQRLCYLDSAATSQKPRRCSRRCPRTTPVRTRTSIAASTRSPRRPHRALRGRPRARGPLLRMGPDRHDLHP